MKRLIILLFALFIIIPRLSIEAFAVKYEFTMDEIDDNIDQEMDDLLEALPENIRSKIIPTDNEHAANISTEYSFSFFLKHIKEEALKVLPDCLNLLSTLIAVILLVALFKSISNPLNIESISPAMEMCFALFSTLTIGALQKNLITMAEGFLENLSSTMLLIVPIMEGIYISLGNYTQATISQTAISLMISFTQSIFTNAISPAIITSIIMSTLSCITGNKALIHATKMLRTIITSAIVLISSLMTFALTLQLNTAATADNFANRTVRFALGSYIPIVGGAVSETYSIIRGSLSLIKSLSGTTSIVILVLICIGPLLALVMSKFSINIAASLSGALNCGREEQLLQEIGSCYSLLIAIVLSSSLMYIIAIAQFCKASVTVV